MFYFFFMYMYTFMYMKCISASICTHYIRRYI